MNKIFAKLGTDEKIVALCVRDQVPQLINLFNEKFGGQWLLVDQLDATCEILKFNDGQIYKGFDAQASEGFRYSKAITVLNKKS